MASVSQLREEIAGINETLAEEPANKMVKYITRTGWHKGEVRYFTPRQYREITGRPPRQSIINKKGRVPWELALDSIATELGYRSDQELKNAIERCRKLRIKLDGLRHQLAVATEIICKRSLKARVSCVRRRIHGKLCKARVVQCDSAEITAVRQPSMWRIHVVRAGQKPSIDNQAGEVRYAKQADKTLRQIASKMETKTTPRRKARKRK